MLLPQPQHQMLHLLGEVMLQLKIIKMEIIRKMTTTQRLQVAVLTLQEMVETALVVVLLGGAATVEVVKQLSKPILKLKLKVKR